MSLYDEHLCANDIITSSPTIFVFKRMQYFALLHSTTTGVAAMPVINIFNSSGDLLKIF